MYNKGEKKCKKFFFGGKMVITAGLNAALHGINKGAFNMRDVGIAMGVALFLQGGMLGLDARKGKLSSSILKLYSWDVGLFVGSDKLILAGKSLYNSLNRNSNTRREFLLSIIIVGG